MAAALPEKIYAAPQAAPDGYVSVTRKEILSYIGRIASLENALSGMLPEGIEDWCDECGGDPDRCPSECDVRIGKVILAQKLAAKENGK